MARREERNGPEHPSLQQALAAHARGSFDVIRGIANECNVGWDDAAGAYPDIFLREAKAVLDRIANARSRR